jgi:hypothetical protein
MQMGDQYAGRVAGGALRGEADHTGNWAEADGEAVTGLSEREIPAGDDARVIAARLEYLVATVHSRSCGPMTDEEVAEQAAQLPEPVILTAAQVRAIRQAHVRRPEPVQLEALAAVFSVKPAYFTDDEVAARTKEQLDLLAMLRDRGLNWQEVNRLAAMAKTPQALRAMVEQMDKAVEANEI